MRISDWSSDVCSSDLKASLAGRYASALFELAAENGTVGAVESDLERLAAALGESRDLQAVTTSPHMSRGEQGSAIAAVAGRLGLRLEERRGGEECAVPCSSRGWPYINKKKKQI